MQKERPVVDMVRRNPHWRYRIFLSAYEVNLESKMLDKILYIFRKK